MPREINSSAIDIFYIDESEGDGIFTVCSLQIPFLDFSGERIQYVWQDYFDAALAWRKNLSRNFNIRFREELHASKLICSKGLFHKSGRNLLPDEALATYTGALTSMTFLPERCLMTAFATQGSNLYGATTIKAALIGLLQRIRTKCDVERKHGLIFFDDGHREYVKFYRQASKYLPTGSRFGQWKTGRSTENMPLNMFLKDGNQKISEFSYFLQIADLVGYSAFLKIKNERGHLQAKRIARGHHSLYDAIPRALINLRATARRKDGIVQI